MSFLGFLRDMFHYYDANSAIEEGKDPRPDLLETSGMQDVKELIEKDVNS